MKKLPKTAFQKGCAPGSGRPKGSRTRLQEFTLQLIDEDFREHGKEILERVREKWPQIYLTCVIGLLPKQSQTIESPLADLSDEEIQMIEEYLAASRAKLVKKLEQHNGHQVMQHLRALLVFVSLLCTQWHRQCDSTPVPGGSCMHADGQGQVAAGDRVFYENPVQCV